MEIPDIVDSKTFHAREKPVACPFGGAPDCGRVAAANHLFGIEGRNVRSNRAGHQSVDEPLRCRLSEYLPLTQDSHSLIDSKT